MLWNQSHAPSNALKYAGIGRNSTLQVNSTIRSDKISWIDNSTSTGEAWITWVTGLQDFLNANLFLGLFSFESHYAMFEPGCFYRRHQDAFSGESNRILSMVMYLNRGWHKQDSGELVLHIGDAPAKQLVITPEFGTLVVFLSEEVPHEVLTTSKERHSIAGWFHANRSSTAYVDPPH